MHVWPVQEAKAKFSELIDHAIAEGPQLVTRHGRATAVLVPYAQWQALQARSGRGLKAVLLDNDAPRFELPIPARGGLNSRQNGPGAGTNVFA